MGFTRQLAERAINENTTYSRDTSQSRYVQRLVAWLIDRPTSDDVDDVDSDDDDNLDDNDDDGRGADTDEMDPYAVFEVKQTRQTAI